MFKLLQNLLIAVGAGITGFFLAMPDTATVYSPEFIKMFVPEEYVPVVTGVVTLLLAISKLVKKKAKKV